MWTPGYYQYGDYGYHWVPGHWVIPPSVGLLWTPGYWGLASSRYAWHAEAKSRGGSEAIGASE